MLIVEDLNTFNSNFSELWTLHTFNSNFSELWTLNTFNFNFSFRSPFGWSEHIILVSMVSPFQRICMFVSRCYFRMFDVAIFSSDGGLAGSGSLQ